MRSGARARGIPPPAVRESRQAPAPHGRHRRLPGRRGLGPTPRPLHSCLPPRVPGSQPAPALPGPGRGLPPAEPPFPAPGRPRRGPPRPGRRDRQREGRRRRLQVLNHHFAPGRQTTVTRGPAGAGAPSAYPQRRSRGGRRAQRTERRVLGSAGCSSHASWYRIPQRSRWDHGERFLLEQRAGPAHCACPLRARRGEASAPGFAQSPTLRGRRGVSCGRWGQVGPGSGRLASKTWQQASPGRRVPAGSHPGAPVRAAMGAWRGVGRSAK